MICSPLGRVKSTAKIALSEANYLSEITYDDRLKEHGFGTWEGLNLEKIEGRFPGMQYQREKDCWNFKLPEGESYAILENAGLGLPKYYEWRSRSGCTFCFFQRKIEWVGLLEKHPESFEKAKKMEKRLLIKAKLRLLRKLLSPKH